jgi:hypothetical protein
MPNFVLVSEAEQGSHYTGQHIRYLIRHSLIKGRKQGGIWLVDLEDLQRYEKEMEAAGSSKFDPTKNKEKDDKLG